MRRTTCPTPGLSKWHFADALLDAGNPVFKFSSPEMHGFLGADFWAEADPRKNSGHGAATPKKLSRFF
jgi:hypothetical protein